MRYRVVLLRKREERVPSLFEELMDQLERAVGRGVPLFVVALPPLLVYFIVTLSETLKLLGEVT